MWVECVGSSVDEGLEGIVGRLVALVPVVGEEKSDFEIGFAVGGKIHPLDRKKEEQGS
jgi:hypothetical protein